MKGRVGVLFGVSSDVLNVIIRRSWIVIVMHGYVHCRARSTIHSFLFTSDFSAGSLSVHILPGRPVLVAGRVEKPLSQPGSFILKIGGQWRVNLRENTRTVRDSRRTRTPGYSRWKVRETDRPMFILCYHVVAAASAALYNVSQTLFSEREPWINFFTLWASFLCKSQGGELVSSRVNAYDFSFRKLYFPLFASRFRPRSRKYKTFPPLPVDYSKSIVPLRKARAIMEFQYFPRERIALQDADRFYE